MDDSLDVQSRVLCAWMSSLPQIPVISDVSLLADTSLLLRVLRSVSGLKISAASTSSDRRDHVENARNVLRALHELGANVELSSADAVADGDRSVILDLMWEVVDACVLRRMFPEAASGREGLLEWVQAQLSSYPKVHVQNFYSSWQDGLALCGLVHSIFPQSFDFLALKADRKVENVTVALTIAEKVLGLPRLLDAPDIIGSGQVTDERVVQLYVSQLAGAIMEGHGSTKRASIPSSNLNGSASEISVSEPPAKFSSVQKVASVTEQEPESTGVVTAVESLSLSDNAAIDRLDVADLGSSSGGLRKCCVCRGPFDRPRLLACGHIMCAKCLIPSFSAGSITCPVCTFPTPAEGGAIAFQRDSAILKVLRILNGSSRLCENCSSCPGTLWCHQCEAIVCQSCYEATHLFRLYTSYKQHDVVPLGDGALAKRVPCCPVHQGEPLCFLSVTSSELLCRDCVLYSGHSEDHYVTIEDAGKQTLDDMGSMVARLAAVSDQIGSCKKAINNRVPGVVSAFETAAQRLSTRAASLEQTLQQRRVAALKDAREVKEAKAERLRLQSRQLQILGDGVEHCALVCGEVIRLASDYEVLKFYRELELHLQAVNSVRATMKPVEDPKVAASVAEFGDAFEEAISSFKRVEEGAADSRLDSSTDSFSSFDCTVVALGGWDGVNNLASCERLNMKTGEWMTGSPLGSRRRGLCAAVLRGSLYVLGGWDGSAYLDTVERFNPRRNSWSHVRRMSQPRCYAGAAATGEKVVVAGGYFGSTNLDTAECLDPDNDSWSALPRMRTARRGLGLASMGGAVYAIGGWDGNNNLSSVEILWPGASSWEEGPSMAVPRSSVAVAVAGNFIYAVGGWDGSSYLSSCEVLDTRSGGWRHIAAMSVPRSYGAAVYMDGKVVVMGGWDGVGSKRLDSVEAYDVKSDVWTPLPAMAAARYGVAAVVL